MTVFSSPQPLLEIVAAQKMGKPAGIYSVCSAHPFVIEACMQQAALDQSYLLIESTCNQVNQFGGYTRMTPIDFSNTIGEIADRMDFPTQRIILGGDHLGPYPWQNETTRTAMDHSRRLVQECVLAGYTKIHLDTSIPCSDDHKKLLDAYHIAERAANLCRVAERVAQKNSAPVYVIGTEVPLPGGEQYNSSRPQVTQPEEAKKTIEIFREIFLKQGLEEAWKRVIALVAQPGIEFGDHVIYEYNREEAGPLSKMIEAIPNIVFEAHSTDYQQPVHLRQMVEDHFAILKVGPGLTFGMREAFFALAHIEDAMPGMDRSGLIEIVERVMLAEPRYWQTYYMGPAEVQAFSLKYSLSDRIRYYWHQPELQKGIKRLITNLSNKPIPLSLISQYLPDLYPQVREGMVANNPISLIHARIQAIIAQYSLACRNARSEL